MARKYKQGQFKPTNPDKYKGTLPIIYRSSWEQRLMVFLDRNPSISKWGSESVVIPYISPIDGRPHRYFTDFIVEFNTKGGETRRAIIEVKPDVQTKPPQPRGKKKENFLNEVVTYEVNKAKWEAANKWCKERGLEFMVLTEYDIGIKKRK